MIPILALMYTLKYVNKTSHFAKNLYFGHNERRFHSGFHSRVKFDPSLLYMIPNRHFIPERVTVQSGMKNGLNSVCCRLFSRAELTMLRSISDV